MHVWMWMKLGKYANERSGAPYTLPTLLGTRREGMFVCILVMIPESFFKMRLAVLESIFDIQIFFSISNQLFIIQ